MAETHIYNVNLRKAKAVSRHRRAGRAINILTDYVQQHSQFDEISVSNKVNEVIWEDGAQNPPHSIEVQVVEDDGVAHVELADVDFELPEDDAEPSEPDFEALKDEEIAEKTVDEVKELVENNAISAQRALDIEYAGKNRKTLIEWLEKRTGEPATVKEAEDEVEAEAEEAEEAVKEAEEEAQEETYDLPDDVVETFRDGTIDDGKDAAKGLGKDEFEKLLNFEEAHQNRKGMKQFLRSNMN
jgi:ribosomal protein L31E